MTVSPFVPYISDIRDGLNYALDDLKLSVSEDDPVEIVTRRAVIR